MNDNEQLRVQTQIDAQDKAKMDATMQTHQAEHQRREQQALHSQVQLMQKQAEVGQGHDAAAQLQAQAQAPVLKKKSCKHKKCLHCHWFAPFHCVLSANKASKRIGCHPQSRGNQERPAMQLNWYHR